MSETEQNIEFRKLLHIPADEYIISTWPNLDDGTMIRIFVAGGPDGKEMTPETGGAQLMEYILAAIERFTVALSEGEEFSPPEGVPGFMKARP